MYINVGGTWKKALDAYINVSGTWKKIVNGYINVSGTWRAFFTTGSVPSYFYFLGNDLYVSTNGYISFDQGNSDLITTESLRSVGILPADLVQNSLKYFSDSQYTYIYWTGRRKSSSTSGEIAYEIWFPNGGDFALLQMSFPSSTYSGTGYWYDKIQRTFSATRTSGFQWKIYFDRSINVLGPVNPGTFFTAKGNNWSNFVSTNNILTAGNTDSGYTKIITRIETPTFGPVTSANTSFYSTVTNYDETYTYNLSTNKGTVSIDTVTNIGRITVTGLASGENATVTVYASKAGSVNSANATFSGSTTVYGPLKPDLLLLSQSSNGFSGTIANYDGVNYSYSISLISTTHSPSSGVGLSFSSPEKQFFYVTGLNTGESATIIITSTVLAGPYQGQTSNSDNFTSSAVLNNATNVSLSTSGSNYSVSWTGFSNASLDHYKVQPFVSTDGTTFQTAGGFGYTTTGTTTSLTFPQSNIGTNVQKLYVVVYGEDANYFQVGDNSPNSNIINNPNYVDPTPPPNLTPSCSATISGNVISFTISNGTPSAWYAQGSMLEYCSPFLSLDGSGRSITLVNVPQGTTISGYIQVNIVGYGYVNSNTVSYTQATEPVYTPPPEFVPPVDPIFPPTRKSIGVTTLIRTPNGLVLAGDLSIGDVLLSADIEGFPYQDYEGATEFALNWTDNNPNITIKETSIVGMQTRTSHFAVAINEDIFSDTHYILIKRGSEARFIYTAYVEPTDMIYNYSSNSWEVIYMLEKVAFEHQVVSINCEPYDIFFTENSLVHDSVSI
jgi:hypothetical protein